MLDRPVKIRDAVFCLAAWLLFHAAFSVADNLTITTYYPSPYGVYNNLRTRGDTFLGMNVDAKTQIGNVNPMDTDLPSIGGSKAEVNGEFLIGSAGVGRLLLGDVAAASLSVVPGVGIRSLGGSLHLEGSSGAGLADITLGRAASQQLVTINGTLRINGPNCGPAIPLPTAPGAPTPLACAGYVTWTPGLYIEGASHQPNSFIYQAGLEYDYFDFPANTVDPNGGLAPTNAGIYSYKAGSGYYFCCPLP